MRVSAEGLSKAHTCDEVRQGGVKILKELQDSVHEKEGVIIPIQDPLVVSLEGLCHKV